MGTAQPGPQLRGRIDERATLDGVLVDVRAQKSRVVVLRGEAGVGKTALLEHLASTASGFRIARAAGAESDMELAFAGVHQLCAPMLDRLDDLPDPQRDALRTALGLSSGPPADRFLVGLAVLSLVSHVADDRPLLCIIDDAHWLDQASAQVLAFVARRLLAEAVAMVFALRDDHERTAFYGLPDLGIAGLNDEDARALLAQAVPGRLDERVRDRIIAETRGNPLALLELPRGWTAARMAGGFVLPDERPLTSRLEQSFARRVRALPPETQQLLVIASAEPTGDATLLWRAADRLEIGVDAAIPAEREELIEISTLVRFRHPLVRSSVYRSAATADRVAAHRALADVTDVVADPDRRAWHRASASTGPDEAVAAELETSATRAQARGGLAAAASMLQRAAELTPDPAQRVTRGIVAVRALLDAGAPEAANVLITRAEGGPVTAIQNAQLQRARAQSVFALNRGSDATPLLLQAATDLLPHDPELARETCLEAFASAMFAGDVANDDALRKVSRSMPVALEPIRPNDLLLDGLVKRTVDGFAVGASPLRDAVSAYRLDDGGDVTVNRWLWLACRIAADLFDHDTWDVLTSRAVRLARDAGALSVLPLAASYRAGVHMHAGEYALASNLMDESESISTSTGSAPLIATMPMLFAYRGDESDAIRWIQAAERDATTRGQGMALSMIGCAHAVLLNGLGRYDEALRAAERACARDELSLFALALVELVEAGVRCGRPDDAAEGLRRLTERTRASGTDWALGLEARSRALLADDPAAHYEEAVERLGRTRLAPHRARAQLVFGEWLRRENRRTEAREQLRAAYDTFAHIGAQAFAERARRELAATGETVRSRSVDTVHHLTAREDQIARLAASGRTNPEIGSELFISARTVEYHLAKVFTKLGIASRRELQQALPAFDPMA